MGLNTQWCADLRSCPITPNCQLFIAICGAEPPLNALKHKTVCGSCAASCTRFMIRPASPQGKTLATISGPQTTLENSGKIFQKFLKQRGCIFGKLFPLLLMDKIQKTTKDDDYPIIYRVLTIPDGCLGFRPSTVCPPHFLLKSSKLTLVLAQNSSSPIGKLLVTLPNLPLLYQDTHRWSSQAVHFNSWGVLALPRGWDDITLDLKITTENRLQKHHGFGLHVSFRAYAHL